MSGKNLSEGVLASPACFRQRVVLPAAQVAGLSDAELKAALAFEVEPFSGIPAAACEMAWRAVEEPDAGRRAFDVVQIRPADLAAEVARARAGGRRVSAVTAVPDAARGERLEDLPRIAVKRRGFAASHPAVLWAAACALLAGGLAWDGLGLHGDVKALRRDVAVRRGLQAEKERLESRAGDLRRQADDIRRRRAEERRAQARAAVVRASLRELLEAVPKACRDESVVRGLRAGEEPAGIVLSGVALSAEAATRTVARLTDELAARKSGWTVRPGTVGGQAAGETCVFDAACAFDPERSGK